MSMCLIDPKSVGPLSQEEIASRFRKLWPECVTEDYNMWPDDPAGRYFFVHPHPDRRAEKTLLVCRESRLRSFPGPYFFFQTESDRLFEQAEVIRRQFESEPA